MTTGLDIIDATSRIDTIDECKRFAKDVSTLSQEERAAFAGELARKRYENEKKIPLVFRNVNHSPNILIMQIFKENNYPVSSDKLEAFFKNPNKDELSIVPDNVVKALAPFYHDYMNDVEQESKQQAIASILGFGSDRHKEILTKLKVDTSGLEANDVKEALERKLNELPEDEVKNIRMDEAKVSFIDQVAFAFLDQRAHEIIREGVEPGDNVRANANLQKEFRLIRKNPELLSGLVKKLDSENHNKYKPPVIDSQLQGKIQEIYVSGKYNELFTKNAFTYASEGNFKKLKQCIVAGASLDAKSKDGKSLLSIVQKKFSKEQLNELKKTESSIKSSISMDSSSSSPRRHQEPNSPRETSSEGSPKSPRGNPLELASGFASKVFNTIRGKKEGSEKKQEQQKVQEPLIQTQSEPVSAVQPATTFKTANVPTSPRPTGIKIGGTRTPSPSSPESPPISPRTTAQTNGRPRENEEDQLAKLSQMQKLSSDLQSSMDDNSKDKGYREPLLIASHRQTFGEKCKNNWLPEILKILQSGKLDDKDKPLVTCIYKAILKMNTTDVSENLNVLVGGFIKKYNEDNKDKKIDIDEAKLGKPILDAILHGKSPSVIVKQVDTPDSPHQKHGLP